MSSTTTVAIDTISHLHVVLIIVRCHVNMGQLNTHKRMKFHIFCCSSVISTDSSYYDNRSHWALS